MFIALSGDHGYALFDELRENYPSQFINCGIIEQAMIGVAAGMAKSGYRPIVYGLASFIPIRVLEQIKLDICFSKLPVILIGDGAGLTYSHLGASHQCAEDLACVLALPNMRVYSPANASEFEACFRDALASKSPCYIRMAKGSDDYTARVDIRGSFLLNQGKTCLISTGTRLDAAYIAARELGISLVSVPMLKPLCASWIVGGFEHLITLEEHSEHGGLASLVRETVSDWEKRPKVSSIALMHQLGGACGSHQYALSEHGMADFQLTDRVRALLRQ